MVMAISIFALAGCGGNVLGSGGDIGFSVRADGFRCLFAGGRSSYITGKEQNVFFFYFCSLIPRF